MKMKIFTLLFALFASFSSLFAQPGDPVLLSPANGSAGVATNVTLDWDTLTAADSFHVQISTETDFSDLVLDDVLADVATEFAVPAGLLSKNTTYYWRVAAYYENTMGSFSPGNNFTTEVQTAPSPVTLLAPANNAPSVPVVGAIFSWTEDQQADHYEIIIAATKGMTDVVERTALLTTPSYTLSSPRTYGREYYWCVISSNSLGAAYSDTFKFKVQEMPPAKVALNNPPNDTDRVELTSHLSWDSVAAATNYRIRLSQNTDLSSPVLDTVVGKIYSIQIASGKLTYLTDYYWTVTAATGGSFGEQSDIFKFTTTGPPPSVPELKLPLSASIDMSLYPVLEWEPVPGADGYHVHISTFNNFVDTVVYGETTTTSYTVSERMNPYTVFYWRVASKNAYALSEWSLFWNFTTLYTGVNSFRAADFGMNVFPNPAAGERRLEFELRRESEVSVFLTDISGKKVMDIAEGSKSAGKHELSFTTEDLAPGIYFLTLSQDGMAQTLKLAVE
jgi:hypothetical protein